MVASPELALKGFQAGSTVVKGIFGGKAAKKQEKAAQEALMRQNAIAGKSQEKTSELYGEGRGALDESKDASLGNIDEGYDKAQGFYGEGLGYAQDSADASQGYASAANADAQNYVAQGAGTARQDLATGLGRAEGTMGQAVALGQRHEAGATTAIGATDVTGQRSRLGELYDNQKSFDFQQDPGYQFRQQQGEEAIMRQASAGGGRMSGATMKALMGYNQGMASQEYAASFARDQQNRSQQQGLAGAADTSQNQLALNQAGRSDTAALAAQQNQMGLSSQGFGAAMEMGQMQNQAGMNQADVSMSLGTQQAGLASALGTQQVGIQQTLGGQQIGITSQQADAAMWQGGQKSGINQNWGNQTNQSFQGEAGDLQKMDMAKMNVQTGGVAFAGGADAAYANTAGELGDQAGKTADQVIDAKMAITGNKGGGKLPKGK